MEYMLRHAAALAAAVLVAAIGLVAQQRPGAPPSPGADPQQPPRDTSAQPRPQPPAATGRITGRVLDAATGRPMKLARVTVNAPDIGQRGAQTDEGGVFDLTGLPAGRYTLTVSKAGYIGLSYGQRRPLQPGTPIQLGEGQHLKGVEFSMPRGSVIAGFVYDEIGDPMPGIMVRLMRFQYAQGVRQLVPAGGGQTDDRGAYRVWGLNPGEYYISAVAPTFNMGGRGMPPGGRGGRGGVAAAGLAARGRLPVPPAPDAPADIDIGYAPTYYPGVPSVFEATPVTLGLGAEMLDLNFNVLLVRTAEISGRATNTDGTPVTSGNINLTPDGAMSRPAPGVSFASRIRWDGFFSIANVPPGRYVIRARGTDDVAPQYAAVPVTVAGEDMTDVTVVLAPGATLTGTVSFQTTQSAVPPDVTQVRIMTQPADAATFGANLNSRVERDGTFTLDGIPIGPYWIRANAPRGWALTSVIIDGRETIDTPLEVRSGQRISGATLHFSDRVSQVNGTVTDQQGLPVTEYTVLAFPADSALWRPQARQIMTARPDQNGSFQLRGLPAGEYFLATIDPAVPGEWYDPAFLDQQRRDATRVTLSDGGVETHNFKITR
jgi:protocatechuate 3,4-dioxygenase beta subunit